MPDIFDTLDAAPKRDIFDAVAESSSDIFDRIESASPSTSTAPAVASSSPSELPSIPGDTTGPEAFGLTAAPEPSVGDATAQSNTAGGSVVPVIEASPADSTAPRELTDEEEKAGMTAYVRGAPEATRADMPVSAIEPGATEFAPRQWEGAGLSPEQQREQDAHSGLIRGIYKKATGENLPQPDPQRIAEGATPSNEEILKAAESGMSQEDFAALMQRGRKVGATPFIGGLVRGVTNFIDGMTTPTNLALLSSFSTAPKAIADIARAAFAGQGSQMVSESTAGAIRAGREGDYGGVAENIIGAAGGAMMVAGGAHRGRVAPESLTHAQSIEVLQQAPTEALTAAVKDPRIAANLHPEVRKIIATEIKQRQASETPEQTAQRQVFEKAEAEALAKAAQVTAPLESAIAGTPDGLLDASKAEAAKSVAALQEAVMRRRAAAVTEAAPSAEAAALPEAIASPQPAAETPTAADTPSPAEPKSEGASASVTTDAPPASPIPEAGPSQTPPRGTQSSAESAALNAELQLSDAQAKTAPKTQTSEPAKPAEAQSAEPVASGENAGNRVEGDTAWLEALLNPSKESASPSPAQNAGYQPLKPIISALHVDLEKQAADWSSRNYKRNKTQIDLHGDGPGKRDSLSIGSINEGRREKVLSAIGDQQRALDKLSEKISTPEGEATFDAEVNKLWEDAGRTFPGSRFKSQGDLFESLLIDSLGIRPARGVYDSLPLSKAIRARLESGKQPVAAPGPQSVPQSAATGAAASPVQESLRIEEPPVRETKPSAPPEPPKPPKEAPPSAPEIPESARELTPEESTQVDALFRQHYKALVARAEQLGAPEPSDAATDAIQTVVKQGVEGDPLPLIYENLKQQQARQWRAATAGKRDVRKNVSAETPLGEEGETTIKDTLAAPEPKPDLSEEILDMHRAIEVALDPRDAAIVKAYYSDDPVTGKQRTLESVGAEFGISKQATGKIVEKSLPLIRAKMPGGPGAEGPLEALEMRLAQELGATSTKNAVMIAERKARNADPVIKDATKGNEQTFSEAEAKVEANPAAGQEIVTGLRNGTKTQVSEVDEAILLYEKVRLRNERNAEADRATDIYESQESRDAARARWSDLEQKINELDEATRKSGSIWGRLGQFRQRLMREDWTFEPMERAARVAKGEALTPEESATITKQADRIAELEKQLGDTQAAIDQTTREQAADVATKELLKQAEAAKHEDPSVQTLVDRIITKLSSAADKARARIRERLARASAGLDPTVLYDVSIIGAEKIAKGAVKFGRWSAEMLSDLGDTIQPYLKDGWAASNEMLDKTVDGATPKEKQVKVKTRIKQTDITGQRDRIEEGLRTRVGEGDSLSELRPLVQKLALNLVRGGIKEREPLVDAVHGIMREIVPTIERNQTMDLISGYGDFKPLDTEAAKVTLRGLKGEMQQIGKISDMQEKVAPKKTGVERRTPTDEERRLIKTVNELKKAGGFVVTDPAAQLKTAMDAIKTRLRNEIRDLDHAIATKEPIANKKGQIEYDAEAAGLREQRDARKSEYDELFPKEPLTDAQRLAMTSRALDRSIGQLEADLKDGRIYPEQKGSRKLTSPEVEAKRSKLEALRSERDLLRALDTATIEAEKEKALVKGITKLQARIAAGDTATKSGKPTVETEKVAALRSTLDALNKQLADMRRGPKKTPEEIALAAYKTRTATKIAELQDRIARGDFSKKLPRPPLKLDPQANKLRIEVEREKVKFATAKKQWELDRRTRIEKGLDTLTKWRRAFILSGPITLAKLTSAAIQRLAFTPIEEGVGAAYSKLFPRLAERAPREGGFNPSAEAKAITAGFTQGMKDSWDILRTGKSDLDVQFHGDHVDLPADAIEFIGHIHGALKAQAKRAEFTRSFEKRVEHAARAGVDVRDPLIQVSLGVAAYKDANRAIFMQDNRVVKAYKLALTAFSQKDKATGAVPPSSQAGAFATKILLPIIKVPTNIVAETIQTATGLITGSARLANAYRKGIETLPEEHADLIMRELKKGSLGGAVMLLGFLSPQVIGGYYQPGEKRKDDDVKAGRVKLYGVEIPSYLLHNPLLEMLQLGATIRRVADSKIKKSDETTQGIPAGLMAGAVGIIEEVPFVQEMPHLQQLLHPHERERFIGELAKSLVIPQAVDWLARFMDQDSEGETRRRKPHGFTENMKMGIPVLREDVPEKRR